MTQFVERFLKIRHLPQAFWIVIAATLLNQTGNMAIVFIMLYLTQSLHFSLVTAACAFGAFGICTFFSGLFGGTYIDKIGALKIMLVTLFLNGTVLSIFPFVKQPLIIALLCAAWGIVYGLYRPASQTFISYLGKGQYKIIFSIYRLVQNLGLSIGPALGGILASYSFSAIFYLNAAANFVAFFILMLGLHKSEWLHYRERFSEKFYMSLAYLRKDVVLRVFILAMVPISIVFFQHDGPLAIFITRDLNLSISFFGFLYTLNTLLIVFFELPLNILTIKWRYKTNFILASALITLAFFCLAFATEKHHIVLLAVTWTIGEMLLYPSAGSYVAEIAPIGKRGSYMGIYSTCANIGLLLGPFLGSLFMQVIGPINLWYLCGLTGLISVYMFSSVRQPLLDVALEAEQL